MLETNKDVRCLINDFAKPFDSVDNLKLIQRLKTANIADNMTQWVVSFLIDRNQSVEMNEKW